MGVAPFAFAAGPAYADGVICSSEGGACAGRLSDGDKVVLCDEKADGHSAVARFHIDGDHLYDYRNTGGAHTCETYGNSWIAEGNPITLKACVGEHSNPDIWTSTCVSRSDHA
ncbi:hypothetical protein ABZX30_09290 [Streptomyces sp. NPDC004542]|uniref:hypothetical protein n=1 Tax=Streptomyces sp. NPDC004542 TaxID=3154281 RepID=UPI0033AE5E2F